MKLYVANCTKQVQDFVYRVPETLGPARMQRIEIGRQVPLSGDLNTKQIDSIIEQHAKYGLVPADEVDRTKPFIGMCYAVDKPVPLTRMQSAIIHNDEVLALRGQHLRQEAAVAVNNAMEDQAPGSGLKELEMTIVEDQRKDGSSPEVNEEIVVSRAPEAGKIGDTPRKGTPRSGRGVRR
jgi:hypothetical protein